MKDKKSLLGKIFLVLECVIIAVCLIFSIIVIAKPGVAGENKQKSKFMPVLTDSMTPTIPVNALVITEDAHKDIYDIGTIVTFIRSADGVNYLDTHRIVGYKYYDTVSSEYKIEYGKKGEVETEADFLQKYSAQGYSVYAYVTRGDKYTDKYGSFDDYGFTKPEVVGTTIGEGSATTTITDVAIFNDPDQFHANIVCIYSTHINGLGGVVYWFMQPTNFFIVILIPLILLFAYNVFGVVKIIIQVKVAKAKSEVKVDEEEIKRRAIEEYLASQAQETQSEQSEQETQGEQDAPAESDTDADA